MKLSVRLCLAVLAAYLAAALYGEAQYRAARMRDETPVYNAVDPGARYLPPLAPAPGTGRRYLLGTDNLGRSVALRLVQGARIAFYVGFLTSFIAIPLGVLLGLLGGYFGGRVDSLVVWLCATVASMPGLLFILAISLVVGKGLLGVIVGIGLTTWVGTCRTIRAETMKHRDRAYVQAAKTLGYSDARIMFRHILPNVSHIMLIQFSLRFPSAVSTEVFISFLGIGVQGEPSWGVMINNARTRLWQGVWWEMAFTTAAIFALVLAFNHLADYLRDRFDPALRSER
ncbi:MAG: ABC transporter permease [Kiritimatiellae bacterium]|jgi:peptide/nickel transport system permease protein|nr:ABC transporter permease [Kiritimatiellia bacterium]